MVLAWIIFATIGELIARYCKSLAYNTKIFGAAVWFRVGPRNLIENFKWSTFHRTFVGQKSLTLDNLFDIFATFLLVRNCY